MRKIKIVQTFWSGTRDSGNPLRLNCGWAFPEYNWMAWAMSALLLRKHYDQLELYTDEIGKRVLIDMLELPYTKVHVVFDRAFRIHPKLFALAKIKTYGLQDQPFIHIDGDLFLWKALPARVMDSQIIASNPEINLHFNKGILDEMEAHFEFIPDYLKNVNSHDSIFSSNAGIFGGSDLAFIKKYCQNALKLVDRNKEHLNKVTIGNVNMLIEQISLFYLAASEKVNISYCVEEPVAHPLYKDYWRFADIPEIPMIHPVGGCKRIPYVLHHLGHRLQLEFPDTYYRIIKYCVDAGIPLRNRLYNHLDFSTLPRGRDLLKEKYFKRASSKTNLNGLIPDFGDVYARTQLTLKYFNPEWPIGDNNLKNCVREQKANDRLSEIFNLETRKFELFENMLNEVGKGQVYAAESGHYGQTASFFLDADWSQRRIGLRKDVALLQVKRPWTYVTKETIAEILEENEKEHWVTLSAEPASFDVSEIQHDSLDAMVLILSKEMIRIEDLLQELTSCFEDEITITDPAYQLLIFDTIKRLAFKNILTLYD